MRADAALPEAALQRLLDPGEVTLLVAVVVANDFLDVVGEVERQVVRVGLVEDLFVRAHRFERELGAAETGNLGHRLADDALEAGSLDGLTAETLHDRR